RFVFGRWCELLGRTRLLCRRWCGGGRRGPRRRRRLLGRRRRDREAEAILGEERFEQERELRQALSAVDRAEGGGGRLQPRQALLELAAQGIAQHEDRPAAFGPEAPKVGAPGLAVGEGAARDPRGRHPPVEASEDLGGAFLVGADLEEGARRLPLGACRADEREEQHCASQAIHAGALVGGGGAGGSSSPPTPKSSSWPPLRERPKVPTPTRRIGARS